MVLKVPVQNEKSLWISKKLEPGVALWPKEGGGAHVLLYPQSPPLLTKLGWDILVESRGVEDALGRTGGAVWSPELKTGLGSSL